MILTYPENLSTIVQIESYTTTTFTDSIFENLFAFALTVLGIEVSAADSRGSFSP